MDRAGRRTVVHLREELCAVEFLERHGAPTNLGPPTVAQLEQVRDFERSVASGAWFETLMTSVGGQDEMEEEDPDLQRCGGPGTASERLRLRISDQQAGWWRRHLEGTHGGRIKARPPASAIHWRLGRQGDIEVRGRELRLAGAV